MRRTDSLKFAIACGFVAAYVLFLMLSLIRGQWILDQRGAPIVTDFLPVYLAGKLALDRHAGEAYDWHGFHQIQTGFVGHSFSGFLGWHYPPLYFVVAAALACLPYAFAFLVWVSVTSAAYAATAQKIANRGALFALALPPVLACAMVGQNGLFSAAILGMMLVWLPDRPYLAGALLAALTFKPQFGILIPIVLVASGYWKTLGVAAVLTLVWIILGFAISPTSMIGFFHHLPETSHAILDEGASGWSKLQSIYGILRLVGANSQIAWSAQIGLALAAGLFTIWLWRSNQSYGLKAAALCTATLLATPYIYYYDLPLLALPLLFLARDRAFDSTDQLLLAALLCALLGFAAVPAPLGLIATTLTAAIVIRRLA